MEMNIVGHRESHDLGLDVLQTGEIQFPKTKERGVYRHVRLLARKRMNFIHLRETNKDSWETFDYTLKITFSIKT